MKNLVLFSTKSYQYLAEKISQNQKIKLGDKETKIFPDGERYVKIGDVLNKDVVIVGGTISDSDTLELYDLACAVSKYGAKSLTLFIPYFGYSTAERAVKKGEVVGAKTRARILSSIPKTPNGNRIFLLDLHSEGIPYYFEGDVQVFHLYAKEVLMSKMREICPDNDFVLGSTDAGRAKWVASLAQEMGVMPAFVYKQRMSGTETAVTGVNANVKDKIVIIYDDMIRTGGSILGAAQAYKDAGAKDIYVLTTHGIFPETTNKNGQRESSLDKLESSPLIKRVYSTNSHPNSLVLQDDQLLDISDIMKF